VALLLEFAVDVPLIVHVDVTAGAVYNPELLMEPHVADQVTDWLAVNCVCPIAWSAMVTGVIVNVPLAVPSPLSATVWGLLLAESPKFNVA
jgi:hypothetical protein